ncbi:helix-turn-helix domain-containing protein [Streptomyces sp. NPDC000410]|uniref:TetR/AcrR family transcriptional regulator n=1 Tax=Streptomyces sp. NPDC000410 TaxID=3154254 RepID=UPI003331538F
MGDKHGPGRTELTVTGQPPVERADAARNREKILDAAARLVAERGPEALTMNAVAQAAGIGVGTVYRRFGDVAQLLLALLDERERQFQAAFLSGPAPLGPDAPPVDRLRAFLHALADHLAEQQTLMFAAEAASPAARYTSGPYLAMHLHVTMLLRRVRPEDDAADAAVLAHMLLAPFLPSLFRHLAVARGTTSDQIKTGVDRLLDGAIPD